MPGRVLMSNVDGTALHEPPFRLVFDCPGESFDRIIVHVTTFAFVVGGLVALFGALGAMPRPVAGFALFWWGGALFARSVARRRRREHGRVMIDFDARRVEHVPPGAPADARTFPLDELTVRLDPPPPPSADQDADEEIEWLLLDPKGAPSLRLGRGRLVEFRKILMIFRQYGVSTPAV